MNDLTPVIAVRSGATAAELSPALARNLRIAGVLGFAGLTAVAAHVAIPIQPYGIPISLQTLAVSMCALTMGARLGALSMVLYIVLGAVGLPMFAGGESGYEYVFGQTGGYLAGFVVAQPIVAIIARSQFGSGWLQVGRRGGPIAVCTAVLAGHVVVLVLGVTWLKLVRDVSGIDVISWSSAWFWGCVVFLPVMFAKAGLAAIFGPWLIERGRRIGC